MAADDLKAPRKKARNGEGNTYKFRNGYRTAIEVKGRVITATGRTATESRKKAKEKLQSLPDTAGTLSIGRDMTFGDYAKNWLETSKNSHLAHSTYIRYLSLLNTHLLPRLGDIRLQHLTKNHINAAVLGMSQTGQSPRSQQQARAVLSSCLSSAVKAELINHNPVTRSERIKQRRTEIKPLTALEVKNLLTTFQGTAMEARLRIALLYGLRQGEALGLQWSDIDFNTSKVSIKKQLQNVNGKKVFVPLKSESSRRTLELDPITLKCLRSHKSQQALMKSENYIENDLVFPAQDGSPKDDKTDSRNWKSALAFCTVEDRRLHDARHTAATLLYDQGADIEVIRRFLGNSSVELTAKTYVHHSARALKGAATLLLKSMN